jgi:hypothetical protein
MSPRAAYPVLAFLAATLSAWPAVAGAAGAGPVEEQDFESLRDRGLEYLKRHRTAVALDWLIKAAETREGVADFRTQLGLARAAYAELVLERAFPAALSAVEFADEDRRMDSALALLSTLKGLFAGVTLEQAPEQKGRVTRGYIHLKDTGGLINRQKKKLFARIQAHFKTTAVSLPLTLYLPFGAYTANLAPFTIEKGGSATAITFLDPPKAKETGTSAWWYVGGGLAAAGAVAAVVLLMSGDDKVSQGLQVDEITTGASP